MKTTILLITALAQLAVVHAQFTIPTDVPVISPATITTGQLLTSVTGGDNLSVGPGTAGFSFTVGADSLVVQGLGIFDVGNNGLTAAHKVGLWDISTAPTLLTSTTIGTSGGVAINSFLFTPVAPLTLQANHSYVLAAQYADVDFDLARGNAAVGINGAVFGHALLSSGTGFGFPDISVPSADAGFFGPNISFAPVPEPAAWSAISAIGLAALAAFRRWKARGQAVAAVA